MSNYTETTNFTALTTAEAVINGAAFDLEYGNIATAIATKFDNLTAGYTGPFKMNTSGASVTLTITGTSGTSALQVTGSGVQLGAPTGGEQGAGTLNVAGGLYINGAPVYSGIPQNSQSAAYTLVLSDAGKHIYHPSADTTARIWTIPANAAVAFPIGTAITFDNDISAGIITLAITSDQLVWLPGSTTGSRSIAAGGQATALKVTATRWHLTGVGIS